MFLYRVKYTDSESDIQNSNSLYKIDHKHQNTLDFWKCLEHFKKIKNKKTKVSKFDVVFCIDSIIHILEVLEFL